MPAVNPREATAILTRIRNRDPQEYERLVQWLDAWTTEVTVAVTEAANDGLQRAVGRAQQARKVLQLFTELP